MSMKTPADSSEAIGTAPASPTLNESTSEIDASSGSIIAHETPEAVRTTDAARISDVPESILDTGVGGYPSAGGKSSHEIGSGADPASRDSENGEPSLPSPCSGARTKPDFSHRKSSGSTRGRGLTTPSKSRSRGKSPVTESRRSTSTPIDDNAPMKPPEESYSPAVLDPSASSFEPQADVPDRILQGMSLIDILKQGKGEFGELTKEARQALFRLGLKSIPAMHGPLTLPYARCPSGIDAFVFSIDRDEDPYTASLAPFLMTEEQAGQPRQTYRVNKVPLPGNARYANAATARNHRVVSAPAAIHHPSPTHMIPVMPVPIVAPPLAQSFAAPNSHHQAASSNSDRRRRSSRTRAKKNKDAIDLMIEEAEQKHSRIPTHLFSSPPLQYAMPAPSLQDAILRASQWPSASSLGNSSSLGVLDVPSLPVSLSAAFYPLPPVSQSLLSGSTVPTKTTSFTFPQHVFQANTPVLDSYAATAQHPYDLNTIGEPDFSHTHTAADLDSLTYQPLYQVLSPSVPALPQTSKAKAHSRGPSLRISDASNSLAGQTIERRRSAAPIVPILGSTSLAQLSPNLVPRARRSSFSSAPFTQSFAEGLHPQTSLILPPTPTTPLLAVTPAAENTPPLRECSPARFQSRRTRSPNQGESNDASEMLAPDLAIKLSDPPAVRSRQNHSRQASDTSATSFHANSSRTSRTKQQVVNVPESMGRSYTAGRSKSKSPMREIVHDNQQNLSVASSIMREPAGVKTSRGRGQGQRRPLRGRERGRGHGADRRKSVNET
ncbi:hypothetical protein OIV83_002835 [Microbotryomycetes sp. JL201]|nr:hypothetical protein OIV83_002835 [Microbotryomycetes sp. JL201]